MHSCGTGLCAGTRSGDEALETVVPPSGAPVASTASLEQGMAYRLRASGNFANGTAGRRCDAEDCFDSGGPSCGVEDRCGNPTSVDIGLAVDDRVVDLDRWRSSAPDGCA